MDTAIAANTTAITLFAVAILAIAVAKAAVTSARFKDWLSVLSVRFVRAQTGALG